MQDLYIVKRLYEKTELESSNSIKWSPLESGGYGAVLKNDIVEIQLKISSPVFRTGPRVVLEISTEDLGKIFIEEPQRFYKKFDSDDDKDLASALKSLHAHIRRKHVDREIDDLATKDERKRVMFNLILEKF